jgi:hypothetical protein
LEKERVRAAGSSQGKKRVENLTDKGIICYTNSDNSNPKLMYYVGDSVIFIATTPVLPLNGKQVSDHRDHTSSSPPPGCRELVALLRLPGVPPPRPAVSLNKSDSLNPIRKSQSPLPIKRRGLPRLRPSIRLPGLPLARSFLQKGSFLRKDISLGRG